jgi:protein gp37
MLMATVEMQEFYAPRINALHTAASVLHTRNDLLRRNAKPILTGISYEPALGPLSIRQYPGIRPHWVIFGGETGTDRRPLQEQWARDIKAECEEFGIPFFMKQMSAYSTTQAAKLIPGDMLLRQYPRMPA